MKDKRRGNARKISAALFVACFAAFAFSGCGKGDEETMRLEEFREGNGEADTQGLAGKEKTSGEDGGGNTTAGSACAEEEEIAAHVCGAVNAPGVYILPAGSRVYEALKAAGGIRSDGCGDIINQAKQIKDGERIYVPTNEEASESKFSGERFGEPAKVNINTASKEELMTLPGIGASKADGIISYRESKGGFGSIEELKNVDGIKEGVFGKLKDKVTV